MYHWTDERIHGHVMICFLAFYLECKFRQLLHGINPELSYTRVLRGVTRIKAVRLNVSGKEFIARTELKGDAYQAFKAVGLRVPSQVIELGVNPQEECGGTNSVVP